MLQNILLFVFGLTVAASRPDPFFRRDYTYVNQFDAFYKVHWKQTGLSWSLAFLACEDEESSMFYPKLKDEWTVVERLMSAMTVRPNESEVFVGMHYEVDLGEFITVDGDGLSTSIITGPMPEDKTLCVTMDIYNGTFKAQECNTNNVELFVCRKKVVVEACPTVDTGYTYIKEIGRCFKIHEKEKTWRKAMETCFMEGGYLAMIMNNSLEAEAIMDKMQLYNTDHFVGFRRIVLPGGDFYTVRGLKLDDTFFIRWNHGESSDTKNDCGVVYKAGGGLYTMTKDCEEPAPFLCEMSSKSYSWSVQQSQLSKVCEHSKTIMLEHTLDNNEEPVMASID